MSIDANMWLEAARQAAGHQHYPTGALYVVATPIGNLADITLRALHVLNLVDLIACEDTRHTSALLRHFGLHKPLLPAHEHNELEAAAQVIERLRAGARVAYVSDAGTPGVSDPGARLVTAVRDAGFRTLPLPGPSSAVAALSVAGVAGIRGQAAGTPALDWWQQGVVFHGFLPAKARERDEALRRVATQPQTQVLFEAPHRIDALAGALAAAMPARRLTVCRELTKQFEQIVTLAAQDWPAWLAEDPQRAKGEFVVVVQAEARAPGEDALAAADEVLKPLLAALPLKQAVALAAQLSGAPRNALYERALALRRESDT